MSLRLDWRKIDWLNFEGSQNLSQDFGQTPAECTKLLRIDLDFLRHQRLDQTSHTPWPNYCRLCNQRIDLARIRLLLRTDSNSTWANITSEKARQTQDWEWRAIVIKGYTSLDANLLAVQSQNSEEVKNKSSRTRDESQQIAGQAYSHAYNTPFKSSRLQGISVCHSNRFNSNATLRHTFRDPRRCEPGYDPERPNAGYFKISSHSRLTFRRFPARLPA